MSRPQARGRALSAPWFVPGGGRARSRATRGASASNQASQRENRPSPPAPVRGRRYTTRPPRGQPCARPTLRHEMHPILLAHTRRPHRETSPSSPNEGRPVQRGATFLVHSCNCNLLETTLADTDHPRIPQIRDYPLGQSDGACRSSGRARGRVIIGGWRSCYSPRSPSG